MSPGEMEALDDMGHKIALSIEGVGIALCDGLKKNAPIPNVADGLFAVAASIDRLARAVGALQRPHGGAET